MTRLDYLLNNLVAAVERRRRLEDIERERRDDFMLNEKDVGVATVDDHNDMLDAYQTAKERRQAADKSVLAIAEHVADEWREK